MMIKYKEGLGKKEWFKWWPWFIVAANIMIANVSDMESALAAFSITGDFSLVLGGHPTKAYSSTADGGTL